MVGAVQRGFEGLEWLNPANIDDGKFELSADKQTLTVVPPSKRDFWQKTYYTPLLVKFDGAALLTKTYPATQKLSIETKLTITREPGGQFDQGGIIVYLDENHWIKTGIEVVDSIPRLSCVVTNEFSDWSTQPWETLELHLRVLQQGDGSYVVQAKWPQSASTTNKDEWHFIRICYLSNALASAKGGLGIGVFACCPDQQRGCTVTFTEFSISEGHDFDHKAS